MKNIWWSWAWLFVLVVGGFGCGSKPGNGNGSSGISAPVGGGSQFWNNQSGKTPGIDWGAAAWGTQGEQTRFLIWSDLGGGGLTLNRPISSANGASFGGSIKVGGRMVTYSWETPDGRGGTFVIDGRAYNMSDGALFLVSGRGADLRIRQLARSPLDADGNTYGFIEKSKNDPDIKAFFEVDPSIK